MVWPKDQRLHKCPRLKALRVWLAGSLTKVIPKGALPLNPLGKRGLTPIFIGYS
jgi:hypothetical protein